MKKTLITLFLTLVLLCGLTSCNSDAKEVSITFSEPSVSMTVGETKNIQPTVEAGKKVKDFAITYSIMGSAATVDQNGTVTAVNPGTVVLVATGNDENQTTAQVTITIKAAAVQTYTVTFDVQGGSTVQAITVNAGAVVAAPATPTKTGYTFNGWLLNGVTYDFATPVNANITLVASWTLNQVVPTTYTVTFDSLGGSAVAAQTVTEGAKATEPTVPTKAGYVFTGWTLNGQAYNFANAVNANITLVASWTEEVQTPVTYIVTFDSQGGSAVASQTVEEGTAATIPTAPTKAGYIFSGWTLDGASYNFSDLVVANITLVATWTEETQTPVTYTVTFNTNGGSAIAPITVNAGNYISAPVAPTKAGYVFCGWDLNGISFDFGTPIVGDITLTACWAPETVTPTEYTVTLNPDGGTVSTTILTFSNPANVSLPTPEKAGYTFLGWYDGTTKVTSITEAKNYTLTAKWEEVVTGPVEYTITYNANGGTVSGAVTTYTVNDEVVLPKPTKSGYVFVGWFETESLVGTVVTKINQGTEGNKVYYAKWVAESTGSTVNISYSLDGGYFVYYNDSREEMVLDFVKDFKAYWSANGYETKMNNMENDGSNFFAQSYTSEGVLLGYTFFTVAENKAKWGWVLDQMNDVRVARGAAKLSDTDTQAASRAELQAWLKGTNGFTYNGVDYEGNYAKFEVYNGWKDYVTAYLASTDAYSKVAKDTAILSSLPSAKKYGYTFAGWYTSADFSDSSKVTSTTTLSQTTVLYAKWDVIEYTVTYNLNGGTNPAGAQTKYSVAEQLVLPTPTKAGVDFAGWYSDSSYTTKVTNTEGLSGNITLYAKWQSSVATVTFNFNGGSAKELYEVNGTKVSTTKVNNYNYGSGSYWGDSNYASYIFINDSTKLSSVKPVSSYRIFFVKDATTGFYRVIGKESQNDNAAPSAAEYEIIISGSYTAGDDAGFNYANIEVGSIIIFDGDFTKAATNNKVTVNFYSPTISSSNLTVTLTTESTLVVPFKPGYNFEGWYDANGKKYTSVNDFTTSVTVTAKWVFDDKVIGAFETQSWVVAGEQINLLAEYASGGAAVVPWESANPNIATVANGVVTGVSEGVATIYAGDPEYPSTRFTFYVTVFAEEPTGIVALLAESNNTEVFTRYNLGIGAGTPVYYADIIGSVSKLLFTPYKENTGYYISSPSRASTLTGSGKGGVDFVCLHYAADMPQGGNAYLTGGKNLASYNHSSTNASWHYSVGMDGIWYCQNTNKGAWHAGVSASMTWTSSGVTTAQVGSDIYTTDVTLGSDGYFYIKGVKTTVKKSSGTKLNSLGLGVKLVGSTWYLGGHQNSGGYGYIGSTGGNNNSIGIETSVRQKSDLWLTWQYSAQLCAKLLIQFELPMNRLVGHHFFSGKDCPQPLLENDNEIWYEFFEMSRQERKLQENYSGYTITVSSDSSYVGNFGRVTSLPSNTQCIKYTVTYKTGSTSKTVTLSTILPGTVA